MAEFYNNEQKERYFKAREKENRNIRKTGTVFFNISKEYEEKYGKDCSKFTMQEILNMYNSCATRSWEQLLNFNSQLKIYTSWCLRENLVDDNQNHYEELDKDEMYQCLNFGLKNTMVITRSELIQTLPSIPNVSDQFLALALFEGLGDYGYKDFYNLMPEQFKEDAVELSRGELKISKQLVALALDSASEYDRFNAEGKTRVGYMDSPEVIKNAANSFKEQTPDSNIKRIQRRLTKLSSDYGNVFTYAGLRNSGRIEYLKNYMKEDNSIDIRETYEKHKQEMEFRFGTLQRIYRWIDEYRKFFD